MESTTKQIDLTPFCSDDPHCRYAIDKPWVIDGWRNATDGKIIVRVPAPGEPNYTVTEPGRGRCPKTDDVLPAVDGKWLPWPTVEPCSKCSASGKVGCDQCGGDGECDQCSCKHLHECGHCDGTGQVTCKACHDPGGFDFMFGETEISRHYAMLVRALPGPVEYLPASKKEGKVRFRFAGGEGAVMGFRD